MEDTDMNVTPVSQPIQRKLWCRLEDGVFNAVINLKAVQRAMQLREVHSVGGQPVLRVPIVSLKEAWVQQMTQNGITAFDGVILTASVGGKGMQADEILEAELAVIEKGLKEEGLFPSWDQRFTPMAEGDVVQQAKRARLVIDQLPGAERVGDVRSLVTQIMLAVKRGRKGDKDKVVAPESPQMQQARQQQAQGDQDTAIRDLLMGLSRDMRRTTAALEQTSSELANTNNTVQALAGRVDKVEVKQDTMQGKVEEIDGQMRRLQEEMQQLRGQGDVWAIQTSQMQRDGKCLLLAGPGVRELYRDKGEGGVRELLQQWNKGYQEQYGGLDLEQYILSARVMLAPFDRQEQRILVTVWDKSVRDELCRRIKVSPARDRQGMYTVACLTQHQRQMKKLVQEQVQGLPHIRIGWAADVIELWQQDKQGAYRIALDQPADKILGLVRHAKEVLGERPVVQRQQQGQTTRYLNAISWNVGGWSDLKHHVINQVVPGGCNGLDIIALQETHGHMQGTLQEFWEKEVCREDGQRGGGIYLAIHHSHKVHEVITGKEFIVASVQVRGEWVIIASVYIPPRNSKYERQYEVVLAELVEAVANLRTNTKGPSQILLVGDFNAHMGGLQGDLGSEEWTQRGEEASVMRVRFTRDTMVDRRGKQLMATVRDQRWKVLNGRCTGDGTGAYTYENRGVRSTLDYVIIEGVTEANMRVMEEFGVVADGHALIVIQQQLTQKGKVTVHEREWACRMRLGGGGDVNSRGDAEINYILCADGLGALRKATLAFPRVEAACQELLREKDWHTPPPLQGEVVEGEMTMQQRQDRGDQLLHLFEEEFACQVDKFLVRKQQRQGKGRRMNPTQARRVLQPWYDEECKAMKEKVYVARTQGRNAVRQCRKQFKCLVRRKKRQYSDWLEQQRVAHPREFWKLLKVRGPECGASQEEVVQHFRELLQPNGNREDEEGGSVPWCTTYHDFTATEVQVAINTLKTGKSKGGNWVCAELLKGYEEEQLAQTISTLFNTFMRVGLPTSWNELLLIPVHKKGAAEVASNFRGIALMPVLAKLFAKCTLNRIEQQAEEAGWRADTQAGFRAGHRVEDNAVLLKSVVEMAQYQGEFMWVCFLDLEKAYDRIKRSHLWEVLEKELGMEPSLLELIKSMYHSVRATVITKEGRAQQTIPVQEGVKQGCPASPIIFSLLMDRVEEFVIKELEQEGGLAAREQRTQQVRIGVIRVLLLLFADDLVLCSRTRWGLQKQLIAVQQFVQANSLKVNTAKSKVMCMGKRPEAGTVSFRGQELERVHQFTYLGLVFDVQATGERMAMEVYNKARRSWARLQPKLYRGGCFQRSTQLLLLDTFVRAHLAFGAPVWGPQGCRQIGEERQGAIAKMCSMYRSAQRSILGIDRQTRNEVLVAISARPPLQVFIQKQVKRYYSAVMEGGNTKPRLVQRVVKELLRIQVPSGQFTAVQGTQVGEMWPSVSAIYSAYIERTAARLHCTQRGLAPQVVNMWVEILEISLLRKRLRVILPVEREEFVRTLPGCRIIGEQAGREGRLWAWPRWLMGVPQGPQELVRMCYEKGAEINEEMIDQLSSL